MSAEATSAGRRWMARRVTSAVQKDSRAVRRRSPSRRNGSRRESVPMTSWTRPSSTPSDPARWRGASMGTPSTASYALYYSHTFTICLVALWQDFYIIRDNRHLNILFAILSISICYTNLFKSNRKHWIIRQYLTLAYYAYYIMPARSLLNFETLRL